MYIHLFILFFNDTSTTEIYTLSLHDALPISGGRFAHCRQDLGRAARAAKPVSPTILARSEEHTSELQSRQYLVCRLLLEKKKKYYKRSGLCVLQILITVYYFDIFQINQNFKL